MYYAYVCKSKNSPITNNPHKYDTLVKARKFGVMKSKEGYVVKIYSRDPFRWGSTKFGFAYPFFMGYVDYHKGMSWPYWNIPDHELSNGEMVFLSRPLYNDGKLAGRF